jgi:flavocytochrome c
MRAPPLLFVKQTRLLRVFLPILLVLVGCSSSISFVGADVPAAALAAAGTTAVISTTDSNSNHTSNNSSNDGSNNSNNNNNNSNNNNNNNHNNNNNNAPFLLDSSHKGPIPELAKTCNMEDLETANDSQLYSILTQLKNTHFFRHFIVDLDTKCPLSLKQQKQKEKDDENKKRLLAKEKQDAADAAVSPMDADDEDEQCASAGLPDLDPDAKPACHVEEDPFGGSGGTGGSSDGGFSTSATFSSSSSSAMTPLPEPQVEVPAEETASSTTATTTTATTTTSIDEADDEFECGGGDDQEDLGMDEDDEPLCTLKGSDYTQPIRSLIAMALESIRYLGWESEAQRRTYQWTKETNPVVTDAATMMMMKSDGDNTKEAFLPDAFWHDMCSSISCNGDTSKIVNLELNPERNTGYNGTHIWNAIYEENCGIFHDENGVGANGNGNEGDAQQCYEERVLFRLLSGLHTSTTLSIAKHYYPPSKRKNRTSWEPNAALFMTKFKNHPEHLRNLHFSYVVLLRALTKASGFLQKFEINTGNVVEDQMASRLLKRLLDSGILQSCESVFSAFDEKLMFADPQAAAVVQQNFKGVFHNISSILDCVQCQQCKLHGKMAMLGYGAALKILFMQREESYSLSLTRNEVVAFINTIAKFSESIREVRELTNLYWQQEQQQQNQAASLAGSSTGVAMGTTLSSSTLNAAAAVTLNGDDSDVVALVDSAFGLVADLARRNRIDSLQETQLVELAMRHDANLLLLVKHYGGTDVDKFLNLAKHLLGLGQEPIVDVEPDAIVIGSGLAGLAAALNLLDRGGTVTVVEKEHLLGGNSNKASSGINACCPNNETYGDFLESFRDDTTKSAGAGARPELISVLVQHSGEAVTWLKERVGVDLSLLAQLGGHSHKRTHRPSNGMAGAEIIYGMQKAVKAYQKEGRAKILVDTKVSSLITDPETGRVLGVKVDGKYGEQSLLGTNVVLATGGFAADRSSGSYLEYYRPELLNMPATAGAFSTGDGVTLARTLGAGTVDMEKVQIHPTGWVDPKDPDNKSKTLAAELMRGVGGVLINGDGKRFCNELGTRSYVSNQMLAHNEHFAKTQQWDKASTIPTFSMVLASSAAEDGQKHVDLYSHKGLLKRIEGLQGLADWMGQDVEVLREMYASYAVSAAAGKDEFGKVSFRGIPRKDLDNEVFYAGTVTPVLHYCMGGITIDVDGNVLTEDGKMIPGLHAAGEVTGGVHGNNRLGGNSLLECTVFGTIVGKKLPIKERRVIAHSLESSKDDANSKKDHIVSMEEVEEHNDDGDCWVVIHGVVYDLTEFAGEHPAGAESIHILAGKDGSEAFAAVHNKDLLHDFEEERIGVLA